MRYILRSYSLNDGFIYQLIDVSYCQWFDPWFLVPLAKCRNLKVLLMVGCRNMKDIIPYASIAATYGYRKLEVRLLSAKSTAAWKERYYKKFWFGYAPVLKNLRFVKSCNKQFFLNFDKYKFFV